MTKQSPVINAIITRNPDGIISVHHRPYNPIKSIKLRKELNDKLLEMAKAKGTSRHAEMVEAIEKHVIKFVKCNMFDN